MGRRGPPPTPTPILRLRGSKRATKKREAAEPKPESGKPVCPSWIDRDAKLAWREIVPQLARMGLATKIDRNALTRYCQLWSRWRKAEMFIQKRGEMYPVKDEAGNVKSFQSWPAVATADRLAQRLSRLESEFGMSPAARRGIGVLGAKGISTAGADQNKARFFARSGA